MLTTVTVPCLPTVYNMFFRTSIKTQIQKYIFHCYFKCLKSDFPLIPTPRLVVMWHGVDDFFRLLYRITDKDMNLCWNVKKLTLKITRIELSFYRMDVEACMICWLFWN